MITLIKVLCNERFRKYFNSFPSTMKHHHQKQIAKNFPLQPKGKQKKSGVLGVLKHEQLQREYELLKCQMLLNGHLWIPCIGIRRKLSGPLSTSLFQAQCGQWTVARNGERKKTNGEESKRAESRRIFCPLSLTPSRRHFFQLTFLCLFPSI